MLTDTETQQAPALRRWSVDGVTFDVKTLWNITVVRGRFDRVGGFYEVGASGTQIELTVDTGSLDTGDPARDEQLRSIDGLGLAEHPQVRFDSTRVRAAGDGKLHVEGKLEAAGKVVPVEFDAKVRRVPGGLELDGSWKVDRRWLGRHGGELPLSATAHVRVHLGEDGRRPTTAY
ncbi:MAG TPA: YceI family protein [Gaiellaceae bacterium]|nr:YceI family protein [Gaiellaceae bacterium]